MKYIIAVTLSNLVSIFLHMPLILERTPECQYQHSQLKLA